MNDADSPEISPPTTKARNRTNDLHLPRHCAVGAIVVLLPLVRVVVPGGTAGYLHAFCWSPLYHSTFSHRTQPHPSMSRQIAAVLLLGLLCFSRPARTSSPHHLLPSTFIFLHQTLVCAATEAQYSVKLVGSGGQSAASLYNSYATYYGYAKDNVALTYTASSVEAALVKYEQHLVDFVGADTALDPEQFNGVQGLAQLPIVGLPLVIGYNLPTLLSTDSLVRPPGRSGPSSSLGSPLLSLAGARGQQPTVYYCLNFWPLRNWPRGGRHTSSP